MCCKYLSLVAECFVGLVKSLIIVENRLFVFLLCLCCAIERSMSTANIIIKVLSLLINSMLIKILVRAFVHSLIDFRGQIHSFFEQVKLNRFLVLSDIFSYSKNCRSTFDRIATVFLLLFSFFFFMLFVRSEYFLRKKLVEA